MNRRRLRDLRDDENGAAVIVLGYMFVVVAIVGAIASMLLASNMANVSMTVNGAKQQALKNAVSSVTGMVNTLGVDTVSSAVAAGGSGPMTVFPMDSTTGVSGEVDVVSVQQSGQNVVVQLTMKTSGRVVSSQSATATLTPVDAAAIGAQVTSGNQFDYTAPAAGTQVLAIYAPASVTVGAVS